LFLNNDLIYDAIFDEAALMDLPDLIAKTCNARSALLHFLNADGSHLSMTHNGPWTSDDMAHYGEHYAQKDLYLNACAQPGIVNRVVNISRDIVPTSSFQNSEIYTDFYRERDNEFLHCMGACFSTPWGTGALGIHRSKFQTGFSQTSIDNLEPFAPALRRMMLIRGELIIRSRDLALSRASLDQLEVAVLQVNGHGKITSINQSAEDILKASTLLRVSKGHLEAADPHRRQLLTAVKRATHRAAPEASMLNFTDHFENGLRVMVTPLPARGGPAEALVTISSSLGREDTMIERIIGFLGLTRAEAEVAAKLTNGKTTAQIAAARGTTDQTVREQLKAIYSKLGCARQSQVAALVLRLPPISL
jgi:DNA-binding CsgD family transcriptional regulator